MEEYAQPKTGPIEARFLLKIIVLTLRKINLNLQRTKGGLLEVGSAKSSKINLRIVGEDTPNIIKEVISTK